MRNLVWGFLCFVLFYSCKKDSGCGYNEQNIVAPASEQQAVQSYLTTNNITSASKDSSGLYYEIVNAGEGDGSPNLCSQVSLTYTGKLISGTVFEQKSTAFTLGSSIEGLRKGLLLIRKGGYMRLYIPPTLAYGSKEIKDESGKVIIPANSILVFDVALTSFY
ncbi:FKBP-type peptidyl-prolyl cis-trans isomerase [Niastella sp. OAS944]|uniref:FKBP-type peptidyl-prolyl cis-trans isomerase n=1 Tax=Niastella sp. OAS944 TaxID=2664089 RepID=UPI00347BE5F5|nr:FKBP-type peptidyl-prolyl cis-trans isomerase FkpA [Chitinophagaceae bacterium OAS944]